MVSDSLDIEMVYTYNGVSKWFGLDFDVYDVVLSRPGTDVEYHVTYHKGLGHDGSPPELREVLECLVSDAWVCENGEASELGMNDAQIMSLYDARDRFRDFLGEHYRDYIEKDWS